MNKAKCLFLFSCIAAIAGTAQASFVNQATDCNPSYSVTKDDIVVAVDTMEDGAISVGYDLDGSVFALAIDGCAKALSVSNNQKLSCGSIDLGRLSRFEGDAQGEPTFWLTLSNSVKFVVTGSCDPHKRLPLTLNIR